MDIPIAKVVDVGSDEDVDVGSDEDVDVGSDEDVDVDEGNMTPLQLMTRSADVAPALLV